MEIKFKIWLEKDGAHVIGKGGAVILRKIQEEGSISAASRELNMSYKYVWDYLKKMEKAVGKVVKSKKGGKSGGSSILTEKGKEILQTYEFYEKLISSIISKNFVRGIVEGNVVKLKGEFEDGSKVIVMEDC